MRGQDSWRRHYQWNVPWKSCTYGRWFSVVPEHHVLVCGINDAKIDGCDDVEKRLRRGVRGERKRRGGRERGEKKERREKWERCC